MAHGALGTDTGGSCRIPAAYNGIVGFKPTQRRVPLDGAVPLSPTLDSIGPLARTVSCCAVLDAVLADEPVTPLQPRPIKGMRLAVPTTVALDDLDDAVAQTLERTLEKLAREGALIERIAVPEFLDIAPMSIKGGFAAAESYAWHRYLIVSKGDIYDPRVASRILRGESQSAADYIDLLGARKSLVARATARLAPADHRQHAAANRRHERRSSIHQGQPAVAAQLHPDQHDRRLRDLAADPSRRRGPGRVDARRIGRIGPPHP
jgi:aspartyl-tRNA(Asn)/glutamyl-tRNA(Gln) amidotransferase subunit A